MNFVHSSYFLYLWLLPLCVFLIILSNRIYRKRLSIFSNKRISELLSHEWSSFRAYTKGIFLILSIALIIFALARPRWGFEWREVPQGGVDIMIVLDLSTSMLATDISPSRLERAKREIIDLLGLLQGDRVGITVFAGVSFVQCPLTKDYRMASMFVNQLSLDMMPVQGTNIGDALKKSIDSLDQYSEASSEGKAIILMTDGEDQGGALVQATKLAKDKGVRVFPIGIGAEEGAPIPLPGGGFKKDRNGNVIVSRLDEASLKNVARETGGDYVRSTSGDMDLDFIYNQKIRVTLDEESTALGKQKVWYERFQWFVLLSIIFLFVESIVPYYRKKKKNKESISKVKAVNLLVFFFIVFTSSFLLNAQILDEAKDAFEKKDYDKASKKYLEAEIEDPHEPKHMYNRAVSLFHNKNYDEAIAGFTKVTNSQNKDLAKKALFNLGNTSVAKGDLEAAVKAYENLLKSYPDDKKSQENRDWVKKRIEEQKKQQEKNNQDNKDQDKKDQDKKDQDKKDQDKKDQDKKDQDKKDQDKKDQDKKDQDSKDQDKKDNQNQENKNQENQDQNQEKQKESGQDKKKENSQKEKSEEENQKPDSDKEEKDQKEKNDQENKSEQQQQQELQEKAMSKEEAQRLLKTIENLDEVYGLPPRVVKPSRAPEKDW